MPLVARGDGADVVNTGHPVCIVPGLMPYLFTVNPDKKIKLLKIAVTVAEATDKQFADQYTQSTTGIKL